MASEGGEVDAVLREKATDVTYDALHDLLDVGIAFPEAKDEVVVSEASVHATTGKPGRPSNERRR